MSVSITNLENLFNNSVNFNDNFRTDTEYKLVLNQNEENRTFLSILDSENNPFLPNPVFFEGIERNLFEKIESLQKNKFIFSWENNSSDVNPIFLDEHDVLSNMFFESGLPLYFKNVKNEISVQEEGFEDSIQYYAFEELDSRKISSTNTLERLNREIRRRSSVVGIFPTTDSYIRLITSYLLEYSEDWQSERCYINANSIKTQKEILFKAA